MSIRGSGRFLLLSFRGRAKLACGIGAVAALLLVGGIAQSGTGFKLMERTGLGQLLHQRAWERALAGHSEMEPWPWEDPSLMANTKVPQLGLSAAVLERLSDQQRRHDKERPQSNAKLTDVSEPAEGFSNVAIGDRLTVTRPDGSTHVYRVTGRRVVDPHLADSEPLSEEGETTPASCSPLDAFVAGSLRVILQATEPEMSEPAPDASTEQKL
jgi:sortase A